MTYDNPHQNHDEQESSLEKRVQRPITKVLAHVAKEVGDIASERGRFCANFSRNVLGSMIVAEMVAVFRQEHPDIQAEPLVHKLENSTELFNNVPLLYFDKTQQQQVPLLDEEGKRLYAPTVFFKRSSGYPSGVITTGPLAGLLVTPPTGYMDKPLSAEIVAQNGLCVERLFNDEAFDDTLPYAPEFDISEVRPTLAYEFMIDFGSKFAKVYNKRIAELRPAATHLEAFFKLAKQHNIPVDEQAFQYFLGKSLRKK